MRPNLLHLKATSPSGEDTRMLVTLLDSSSSSMSGGGAGNGKPTVEERGDSDGSVVACTSIALTQPNDLETVNLMDTTAVQHLLSLSLALLPGSSLLASSDAFLPIRSFVFSCWIQYLFRYIAS